MKKTKIGEAMNNALPSNIKNYGDIPSPATDLNPKDKRPSRGVDATPDPGDNYLPTHIDNKEMQLGVNIETKKNPALKGNVKAAVKIVLNNLNKNKRYYSLMISNQEVKDPAILALYKNLFKQDASYLIPYNSFSQTTFESIKEIIRTEIKRYLHSSTPLNRLK